MRPLLEEISKKTIQFEDFAFTEEQKRTGWLGNTPATEIEIFEAEKRLGVTFPNDYKTFLSVTNGFSAPNDIEPSFENIINIDYLKNIDNETIEIYQDPILDRSILIGGIEEEQYFLLIPPHSSSANWKYWKFANWFPGEQEFESLEAYFLNVLDFIKNEHENKNNYR